MEINFEYLLSWQTMQYAGLVWADFSRLCPLHYYIFWLWLSLHKSECEIFFFLSQIWVMNEASVPNQAWRNLSRNVWLIHAKKGEIGSYLSYTIKVDKLLKAYPWLRKSWSQGKILPRFSVYETRAKVS